MKQIFKYVLLKVKKWAMVGFDSQIHVLCVNRRLSPFSVLRHLNQMKANSSLRNTGQSLQPSCLDYKLPWGPALNSQRHVCHLVLHNRSPPHCQGGAERLVLSDRRWCGLFGGISGALGSNSLHPIFPISPSWYLKCPQHLLRNSIQKYLPY